MITIPLGGLVGSGMPSFAIASGQASAGIATMGLCLLALCALVIVLASREGQP